MVLALGSGALFWAGADVARAQEQALRVLMLYPYTNLFPVSVITGDATRKRMIERSQQSLEFYSDFLDLGRFSEDAHEARTAQFLFDKYRDRRPDVVIALGPRSLEFLIKHPVGSNVPVVFCCTSRARLAILKPPDNVTGIISEFDLTKTMALAQRLQPNAKDVIVVAGATEFDQQSAKIARLQLAPYEQKYDVKYLVGLPHDALMENLKRLPGDAIVILMTMFADGAGRLFIPPEIVRDIARTASAAVYSPYETYLGRGVVGGHMDSFEQIGAEVADVALQVLAGASPSSLTPQPTTGNADRVDWRQLKRWNISESSLPPGSEVHFREFTLWEQYRWHMIGILAVVLFQAAIITWSLFEHRRRYIAERQSRQRLSEVIHLNRSALTGALSASVAHELNQPLGAIQNYAEAASIYLRANPPNFGRIEEILENIRRDNQRAADIIGHLRGLLQKKDVELQEFDINDIVRSVVQILDSEALKRGMKLSAYHGEGALPVRADHVHLQQVILNLAVNGMDAMQDCVSGTGKMSIQTVLAGDSEVEIRVTDSGTGIPADKLNKVFDTFYTTKGEGTGLGLSIARTIVENYGGRIWAENSPGGGATFRFTLPLAKTVAA
jgi:signal transduction histidine kinase